MKKISLLLILLLAFIVMPSSSFAAAKKVAAKKAVANKAVVKKAMAKKAVKGITTAQAKEVQQILSKDGLYKGKVDGYIGPKTVEAVKAFQKKKGLKADGIIGPKTLKAIGVK